MNPTQPIQFPAAAEMVPHDPETTQVSSCLDRRKGVTYAGPEVITRSHMAFRKTLTPGSILARLTIGSLI